MGMHFESEFSKKISKNEVPFLISEKLLREMGLGQVDFAKLIPKKKIIIYELKTSHHPTYIQMKRLLKTQDYLSRVLEIEVEFKIRLCQKTNDSLF